MHPWAPGRLSCARKLDADEHLGYTPYMNDEISDPSTPQHAKSPTQTAVSKQRDERRKTALKSNMARRKAQIRGRKLSDDPVNGGVTDCAAKPETE